MAAAGVRRIAHRIKRYHRAPQIHKPFNWIKARKEFVLFLGMVAVLLAVKIVFKWEFPVAFFDLAEHSALVVEIASMLTGGEA